MNSVRYIPFYFITNLYDKKTVLIDVLINSMINILFKYAKILTKKIL